MKIFFIIPVFNDHVSLLKLLNDLKNLFKNSKYEIEFIIVDDASTKRFENVNEFHGNHYIKLKTNRGNQAAIHVGMCYLKDLKVDYNYCIIMDSDGEDNPEHVPQLIKKCQNLGDMCIVFAARKKRNEGTVYKFFYFFYKLIFKILTGQKFNFGNFSCVPKKFFVNILDIPTISFHYSASILKSKIPHETISFNKGKRYDGNTQTKITTIILHALNSLSIYYKEILVKFLIFSAIGWVLGIISIIFIIINKFFSSFVLIGWSSDMVLGLSIITIMFLFMFFACLFILLNKNPYEQSANNLQNYKSLIDEIKI